VLRALAKEPADRFDTALAMAEAVEAAVPPAPSRAIGQWVRDLAGDRLAERAQLVAAVEGNTPAPRPDPAATIPDEAERAHTSVSVASDREKALPPRRGSWAWVALGGIVVGGGAATLAMSRGQDGRPAPAVTSASVPSMVPAAAPPSPPATTTATTTVADTPSAPVAAPAVSASPSSSPRIPAAPTHVGGRMVHPRLAPAAPSPAPPPTSLYGRE
jgi:serine/threonine-protein kinase